MPQHCPKRLLLKSVCITHCPKRLLLKSVHHTAACPKRLLLKSVHHTAPARTWVAETGKLHRLTCMRVSVGERMVRCGAVCIGAGWIDFGRANRALQVEEESLPGRCGLWTSGVRQGCRSLAFPAKVPPPSPSVRLLFCRGRFWSTPAHYLRTGSRSWSGQLRQGCP